MWIDGRQRGISYGRCHGYVAGNQIQNDIRGIYWDITSYNKQSYHGDTQRDIISK